MDILVRQTLYSGVRNPAGNNAAAICDGFGTILAAEIVAGNVVPVILGAINATNAVTQVEKLCGAVDVAIRESAEGFLIHCSHDFVEKYKQHYRTLNGYAYKPQDDGRYKIDGYNAYLMPQAMMGNSQRLIATVPGNLVVGTDTNSVAVHATARRNIIEGRHMMPLGTQFADLEVLWVNELA